jgi:RNA exonuclease 4
LKLLKGKVIIGHTIRHDLEVLNIKDVQFINVAYYSKAHKHQEALRKLTRRVLNARIQESVHSSIIDARAAMALFRSNMHYFELRLKRN